MKFSSIILALFISLPAMAYDVDTHFYLTYLMARWSGFSHDVAGQMAAGSAWIDVSLLTTPMMGVPIYMGARLRRLYHFPGQVRKVNGSSAHGIGKIGLFGEAQPNDPMASMLAAEGMHDGDFIKLIAAIHIEEDSFGHAGYNPDMGHGYDGHNPDRFFFEPEKYRTMIKRLFSLMWAARELMPKSGSAFDQDMLAKNDPRLKMMPDELAEDFLEKSGINKIIETNFLRHREYVKTAVRFFLEHFEKVGYFQDHVTADMLMPNDDFFAVDQSVTEALQKLLIPMIVRERKFVVEHHGKDLLDPIVGELLQSGDPLAKQNIVLNVPKIIHDAMPGLPFGEVSIEKIAANLSQEAPLHPNTAKFLEALKNDDKTDDLVAALSIISERVIRIVLIGQIPTDFSQVHKAEFEHDGIIRKKELSLRESAFQDLISENFGRNIQFEPVKLTKALIAGWNKTADRNDGDGKREIITLSAGNQIKWVYNMNKINLSVWKYNEALPWYTLYQYPEEFRARVRSGFFKPLLTDEQVRKMGTPGSLSCGQLLVNAN